MIFCQAVHVHMKILTFWIVLQQEVEVSQLAENVRVHFALCFQNESVVAANSLHRRAAALKGATQPQ